MTTFKNKNFTKRDYEATNVVFCQSFTAPDANWKKCKESEIKAMKCGKLYVKDCVRYFGYL
jgi:hypothetical protein